MAAQSTHHQASSTGAVPQNVAMGSGSSSGAQTGASPSVGGSSGNVKVAAKKAGERITDTAMSAADDLKQRGSDMVSRQKAKAAGELSTLGSAIRSAAEKLRGDDEQAVAGYADMAADRLEGAAQFLESKDVGGIVRDLERAARERPAIFLGGMFLAGLGISRFLKASQPADA